MSEIRCSRTGCGKDARYIDGGSSYCEAHYGGQRDDQAKLAVRWVYLAGLILWVGIWLWTLGWLGPQWLARKVLPVYLGSEWLLGIPVGIGLFVLAINLRLWWTPKGYASYETEVEVIEFVERNASWFLIASGAFLTAASFFLTRPLGATAAAPPLARKALEAVLTFESASLFFLLLVVLLYWSPPQPKNLALLRHIKTVPFTYGVSFFAAAFTALIKGAIS